MNILIVGTGYVGLVTGACFAEMGHHVLCIDIDTKKIADLEKGIIPIFEPGLEEIVRRNIEAKRLKFTTDYKTGVAESLICVLAVPTPSDEDGSCDLQYVLSAAKEIGRSMPDYRIIVNKSTVPVGSAAKVRQAILEAQLKSIPFDVVSNPEFLKEGSAVADCMKPDRIIIGVDSPKAASMMKEVYKGFVVNHDRILIMDTCSAEMTKYAANAMLATRISFMNEMAGLCEKMGANINSVRIGIGSDQRIGYHFLYAGIGYGGSCFPKDIRALKAMAKTAGAEALILEAVDTINERQQRLLVQKIYLYFKSNVANKTIPIWGLAFKPNTDDIREAPALKLIEELVALGACLRLYDPVAMKKAKDYLSHYPYLTWCEFEQILQKMQGRAFFDGRNQYIQQEMSAKGFDYFGIGLPH